MNDRTQLGDAKRRMRDEIRRLQTALHILEALTAQVPSALPTNHTNQSVPLPNLSVGLAGVEILRRAGKPLHGLNQIVPALLAAGYHIQPHGLATTLLRTGLVDRVGRGTFAAKAIDPNGPIETALGRTG